MAVAMAAGRAADRAEAGAAAALATATVAGSGEDVMTGRARASRARLDGRAREVALPQRRSMS